jgi:chromosome segregation ATPase
MTLTAEDIEAIKIALEPRFEKIEREIRELTHKVDLRFMAIELRLDKIEGRLDLVEARLEKIEGRLDVIDTRLEKIEYRLVSLPSRSLF